MSAKYKSRAPQPKVFVDTEVLRQIRQHARSHSKTEVCGVLIGGEEDRGLRVAACIAGVNAAQAGTHVTFTQDTWEHIYKIKDQRFPGERIVGWYHSHPGFGVFLSDHDTFIHKNFFSSPSQVAWVYDPHSDEEGCFGWAADRIERLSQIFVEDRRGGEGAGETGKPEPFAVAEDEEISEAESAQNETVDPPWVRLVFWVLTHATLLALGFFVGYLFFPRVLIWPIDGRTGVPMIDRPVSESQLKRMADEARKQMAMPPAPAQQTPEGGKEPNAPSDKNEPIKITLEDLASVEQAAPIVAGNAAPAGTKNYGNVTEATEPPIQTKEERGSILLQAWFYLGVAGLLGALAGWGITERSLVDGPRHRWGNTWILPLVVTLQCVGFAVAESIVERSTKKALTRGLLALPLGVILGFIFDFAANLIFAIGVSMAFELGLRTSHNPAFWVVRGIAWMVFGAAGGVVYGIIGLSGKKTAYGVLGGVIGAGIGGMIFDPIAFLTNGGAASRAVGFGILGLATGAAIGLVESALKDRWLYVTAGPLAGKQFILYKPRTLIGSEQGNDIYLFKDANILPQHAVIEAVGTRVQLRALGSVYVSGQPAKLVVLQSGNTVQIGRYAFCYQERQRK